jgi:hypothetical protein
MKYRLLLVAVVIRKLGIKNNPYMKCKYLKSLAIVLIEDTRLNNYNLCK